MSRLSSNCSVTREEPSELLDVISVTPAIRPSGRSSGVATVAAMVSGLAPGSDAETEMVGKSTWGSGDTGSRRNAAAPARARPMVSSVVATGRSMKGADRLTCQSRGLVSCCAISIADRRLGCRFLLAFAALLDAPGQPVEGQVDHRRGEQGEHLADDQ